MHEPSPLSFGAPPSKQHLPLFKIPISEAIGTESLRGQRQHTAEGWINVPSKCESIEKRFNPRPENQAEKYYPQHHTRGATC